MCVGNKSGFVNVYKLDHYAWYINKIYVKILKKWILYKTSKKDILSLYTKNKVFFLKTKKCIYSLYKKKSFFL